MSRVVAITFVEDARLQVRVPQSYDRWSQLKAFYDISREFLEHATDLLGAVGQFLDHDICDQGHESPIPNSLYQTHGVFCKLLVETPSENRDPGRSATVSQYMPFRFFSSQSAPLDAGIRERTMFLHLAGR
jgi:hypothetical protein